MITAQKSTKNQNTKTTPVQERRVTTRHECDGFAEVVIPGKGFLFRGEIGNLSEVGCYVATRARLNIRRSTEVELRFTVNGDQFNVVARTVAVKSSSGARFEFSLIDPTTHKNLLELIEELRELEALKGTEPAGKPEGSSARFRPRVKSPLTADAPPPS